MFDSYGRNIDYLRVSITDRCNLRCGYCMPDGVESCGHNNVLSYEDILRLCGIFASLGVSKFRITGGEPLVRKGCEWFAAELRKIPGVEHLGLTTNAVLLKNALGGLTVDAVNISLDALDRELYRRITGFDALPDVLDGIDAAIGRGIAVRINAVLLGGLNDSEIEVLAQLAEDRPVSVRFIERMPIGAGAKYGFFPCSDALERLLRVYPDLSPLEASATPGPARYFGSAGLRGNIGFISALSHHFCGDCNRVRLSSEGFLRLCLFHEDGLDLRALLKLGASDDEIRAAIAGAVERKPERHMFREESDMALSGLYQIGG